MVKKKEKTVYFPASLGIIIDILKVSKPIHHGDAMKLGPLNHIHHIIQCTKKVYTVLLRTRHMINDYA